MQKKILSALILLSTALSTALPVSAASGTDIQSSPLFTGLMDLLGDASTAMMAAAPVLAVFILGYYAIRKMIASEQHEIQEYNKKMRNTAICLAIVFGAGAIVGIVSHYFG